MVVGFTELVDRKWDSGTLTLGIFENWDKIFCTDFSRKTQK